MSGDPALDFSRALSGRETETALRAFRADMPLEQTPAPLENLCQELAAYVQQLGRIVAAMQRRMDEMEQESARRATISHAQALQLQRAIRARAAEICRQYALNDPQDAAAFRAAIRKELLARWQVRDLHDLPLNALCGAGEQIARYADFGLVMERRKNHGTKDLAP